MDKSYLVARVDKQAENDRVSKRSGEPKRYVIDYILLGLGVIAIFATAMVIAGGIIAIIIAVFSLPNP